jgi:hypothetical protein
MASPSFPLIKKKEKSQKSKKWVLSRGEAY